MTPEDGTRDPSKAEERLQQGRGKGLAISLKGERIAAFNREGL